MIKEIPLNGYSAMLSDYICADGELSQSMNVINEDGGLRPTLPPNILHRLSEGKDCVFIHKISSQHTFYIIITSNGQLQYTEDFAVYTDIDGATLPVGRQAQFSAVGNIILVTIPDTDFFYLRYAADMGTYYKVASDIPFLGIRFGLRGATYSHSYRDTGFTLAEYNSSNPITTYDSVVFSTTLNTNNSWMPEDDGWYSVNMPRGMYRVLMSKAVHLGISIEVSDGRFSETWTVVSDGGNHQHAIGFDATKLRYKATGPSYWSVTIYKIDEYITGELYPKNNAETLNAVMGCCNKFIAKVHKDKCFMYPFFVRYALRLYDGSHTQLSPPIAMMCGTGTNPFIGYNRSEKAITLETIKCQLLYAVFDTRHQNINDEDVPLLYDGRQADILNRLKTDFRDIVIAVDVYVSPPIYGYNQGYEFDENKINTREREAEDYSNYALCSMDGKDNRFGKHYLCQNSHLEESWEAQDIYNLQPPMFTDEQIMRKVCDTANFYKIASIPLEELQPATYVATFPSHYEWSELKIDDGALETLETRPTLKQDSIKDFKILPENIITYNARVAAAFSYEYLPEACGIEFCNAYTNEIQNSVRVKVYLHTDDGDKVVWTEVSEFNALAYAVWFYYPDTRAYAAEIYVHKENTPNGEDYQEEYCADIRRLELKRHDFLPGAYWVSNNMHPVRIMPSSILATNQPDITSDNLYHGPARIYLSETNNPFIFTSSTTIGSGNIIAMATATKALSQGQFGQFPIYAFTSEGIWALELTSTGTFSTRHPVTRDVCINPDSITQIDNGVLFASERGIMLLQGSEAICISDSINTEHPFLMLALPYADRLYPAEMEVTYTIRPFKEFLRSCRMLYDYPHQRIIVYGNPDEYPYAYVYSFKSKMWGLIQSNFKHGLNSYPEALAVDDNLNIVDFSQSNETSVDGIVLTRPIKLNEPDILKTISDIVVRGDFAKGHVKLVLYASNDLRKWFVVHSSASHHLRSFSGSGYKYFRLLLVLDNFCENESIESISLDYRSKATNRLR